MTQNYDRTVTQLSAVGEVDVNFLETLERDVSTVSGESRYSKTVVN
jgi:hypothetical protein